MPPLTVHMELTKLTCKGWHKLLKGSFDLSSGAIPAIQYPVACLLELALLSQADAHLPAISKLLINPVSTRGKVQVDIVLKGFHRYPAAIEEHLQCSKVQRRYKKHGVVCMTTSSKLVITWHGLMV